jgi:beta-carotene ketolase (CrtO type)
VIVAGGERHAARRAVVSQIDARRLFGDLVAAELVPERVRAEVSRMHVGHHNVSELKVDAIIEGMPAVPGPAGFDRSLLLSSNGGSDLERSFARIRLGLLPERPPLMVAFPSVLEPGWAPPGRNSVWLSTWVPWRQADGRSWSEGDLEAAADAAWEAAERALGDRMPVVERALTGPEQWVDRNGNPQGNPNHVEMSIDQLLGMRPSPSLAGYRTPIAGLFLTGSGTHPGGGVTGAPGRNAAAVVLQELGLRSRPRGERLRAQVALLRDAARAARALRKAA